MTTEENKKPQQSRFQRQANILIWKCYLQRQRRWRLLVLEALFATMLFVIAVFIAKPVFLIPLEARPENPLTTADIIASLDAENILGYAPDVGPYVDIMRQAANRLKINAISAPTEDDLNNILYNKAMSKGVPLQNPIIWVLWDSKEINTWKFTIRSTERAKYEASVELNEYPNPHLRAGFLAVQLAVSEAIIAHSSASKLNYQLSLVSMPVSPLMQQTRVRRALSGILLCFILALLPPVLETEALVVTETLSRFKRGLRIRNVQYSSMYIGWLSYAFMTALPICLLASITLILIFRWIHLLFALLIILAYVSVMIMLALIMAMFHNKAWIACVWSTLFTFLQTFLAELVVCHEYDMQHGALTFLLHLVIPPLGLIHGFNEFALLQTGRGGGDTPDVHSHSLFFTVSSWSLLILLYFGLLMLLQRTLGNIQTIGGQVSWKSIIFKKQEDVNRLRAIETPTGRERDKLQEVDDLVAKAISFRNVSKSIMGVPVLSNLTLDIYRGEFNNIFAERIQMKMIITIEDLLTGLTYPDKGTINVLGHDLKPGNNFTTLSHMMGYCHRAKFLIGDLTVQEHFSLFMEICLWNETSEYVNEYGHLRSNTLLHECDLMNVRDVRVKNLGMYYRAQLCWALAMLLEPRIVMIPNFTDQPRYLAVIKDKIMKYKKYVTIVKLSFSGNQLEYADRVFLFDNKILAFGGTPAYMFFKYGREYRVRMTLRGDGSLDDEGVAELIQKASQTGATVRAHLGSLLILRLPSNPTAKVAALVKDFMDNANRYGLTSLNISLPDSDEVCRRAIYESRTGVYETPALAHQAAKAALKRIAEPLKWERTSSRYTNATHLCCIGWKYISYYVHYKLFFALTIIAALIAGVSMGLSLSTLLVNLEKDRAFNRTIHREILTVEYLKPQTTLVLHTDSSINARSIANAYVLSEPKATDNDIYNMRYTALSYKESLTDYLITRAVDSPQQYVYLYAYGMDVSTAANGTLIVQALYSPLHYDYGAAARSLARVFMALQRHYTGSFDATIQVTDDPLDLDFTPWMKRATMPPLLIQFFLILTISHITLIPSMEYGLIRHMQSHAMNFSPTRYWFSLYFWDLVMYWMVVVLMSAILYLIMFLVVAQDHFHYTDLLVVPMVLFSYGLGCVPQAYLFSLGPRGALNSMTFIIVNIVFGETTAIAKILYGNTLNYALQFMRLSPQLNMAHAYVKIKQIFLYNSECVLFKAKNYCSSTTLHKCCQKCGVLQTCFARKTYLSFQSGVLTEVIVMITIAVTFMILLLLLQYMIIQRCWKYLMSLWTHRRYPKKDQNEVLMPGAESEMKNVLNKTKQIKLKHQEKNNTFGEHLIASNVSRKEGNAYVVRDVYLGLGKGEILALSGLKRHGRLKLCELLAGYKLPSEGEVWCMAKWSLLPEPHKYARQVSISCERAPLPHWMTVYDGLKMIAILRGVPKKHVNQELMNFIEALELQELANTPVCRLLPNDKTRLYFAAAVIGAPPIIILDECTAYQKYSVRRAMYFILYHLRKKGHAIFISSSSVESHMPVTSRLAVMLDGRIYDVDTVDKFVERYSNKGYTVVVHLKDEVDVTAMFAKYFKKFVINDTTEVLVNAQVLDHDLNWANIFEKMETLKAENHQIYSYIVCAIPIDYIYNAIINNEKGNKKVRAIVPCFHTAKKEIGPKKEKLSALKPFEQKYHITKLKELPWSVIFQR